jgi:hypothetical protein
MRIELSSEQELLLMAWIEKHTAAEVAADCEPSGYELTVSVSSYGIEAEARAGSRVLDLGSVQLVLTDPGWMRQSYLESQSWVSRCSADAPAHPRTIDAVLASIRAAWLADPSLRLGQLLVNATRSAMPVPELYYLGNEELRDRVDAMRLQSREERGSR